MAPTGGVTSLSLSFLIFNQRRQRWWQLIQRGCWQSAERAFGKCSVPSLARGKPSTGRSPSAHLGSRHPTSRSLCSYHQIRINFVLFVKHSDFVLCWKSMDHMATKYFLLTYSLLQLCLHKSDWFLWLLPHCWGSFLRIREIWIILNVCMRFNHSEERCLLLFQQLESSS